MKTKNQNFMVLAVLTFLVAFCVMSATGVMTVGVCFAGIAFSQQCPDVAVCLLAQLELEVIADAVHVGAVTLGEVKLLEFGVETREIRADPLSRMHRN